MIRRTIAGAAVCFFLNAGLGAEPIRVLAAGTCEVALEGGEVSLSLPYYGAAFVTLAGDMRFVRGVELKVSSPREFMRYRGSLAAVLYGGLRAASGAELPREGVADLEASQLFFAPLPEKLATIYQIPIAPRHGMKSTPYASVPVDTIAPERFPLLFRLMPVMKGISAELEAMRFGFSAKPILSGEGAARFSFRYPEQLGERAFTLLVDNAPVTRRGEDLLLKAGEHSLVIVSDDYRNESRRFKIEEAKVLDLLIDLQDPTPLIIFEAPENARIYLDNALVEDQGKALAVEPGQHEARFQVGDYTVLRPLHIQKGKTYRVSLAVDVEVSEE
ncbi:MAG: hypothetical protein LBR16_05680 [Treponema sp.]|jgi:hypothetical protein|nr:hypothetical protein [Treponema sp.]